MECHSPTVRGVFVRLSSGLNGQESKDPLTGTFWGGSPGNRTLNLRIKSPLLCLVELATPSGIVVAHERSVRGWLIDVAHAR